MNTSEEFKWNEPAVESGFSNAAGILYLSVMVICGSVWLLYFKCYKKRFVTKTKGIEWETTSPREKEYDVKSYFKIVSNSADSEISIVDPTRKKQYGQPDFTMPGLIAETPEADEEPFGLSSAALELSDSDVTTKNKFIPQDSPTAHSVNGLNKY